MKKTHEYEEPDSRPEYDFRGGVRRKYVERFSDGRNIVVLEPDVAAVFTDSDSVNHALRKLISERQQGQTDG